MLLHTFHWPLGPHENLTQPKARIVFLHGMGGTGALWRPIAASLENEYAILAMDQRGHGQSRGENLGYSPLDYGQDVIETLEKTDFRPTWIVGHSMGVRTACAAAHLKPQDVQGLILIDLGFSGQAGGGLGESLGNFLQVLPQEFNSRNEARAFMDQHCPDPSIAQYLMAVSVRAPTPEAPERIHFPFDHAALIQTIEAARDSSVRKWVEELATGGMPILVLRGAESLVWSRQEFEKEKAHFSRYPSIRFEEIEGASHGLPFEKRLQFVERLKSFIENAS